MGQAWKVSWPPTLNLNRVGFTKSTPLKAVKSDFDFIFHKDLPTNNHSSLNDSNKNSALFNYETFDLILMASGETELTLRKMLKAIWEPKK